MIATQVNWGVVFLDGTRERMEGWCSEEKAQALYELVIDTNAQLCFEIGVFGGKSFVAMGLACKDKMSGGVIGMDPWKNEACLEGSNSEANDKWWMSLDMKKIYEGCMSAVDRLGLFDQCNVLKTKSATAAILFSDNVADIIHQDGNHNYESISKELKLWVPKLKVGGYWICDDTNWIEAKDGYALLPSFGLELVKDYDSWQIWKKVK